ncbi:hypothetical protein FB451DRAFT_313658 [Mycena latifolia]|nr:hypothetical protein FB451DRAFT_313658 [Mycena latifolia]
MIDPASRLDGPSLRFARLSFASLESLVMCIWKFTVAVGTREVDRQCECNNVVALLQAVSGSLTTLTISGDLLSLHFLSLKWPHLQKFVITEHTPTPYLSVPELTSQMPALRVQVLFSADLARRDTELRPPFALGTLGRLWMRLRISALLHSSIYSMLILSSVSFHKIWMRSISERRATFTYRTAMHQNPSRRPH